MDISYAIVFLHQTESFEAEVLLHRNITGDAVAGHAGFVGLDNFQHIAHFGCGHKKGFYVVVAVTAAPDHLKSEVYLSIWADNHMLTSM